MVKTLPFLIGLLAGYGLSLILTIAGVAPLVNIAALDFNRIIAMPDFAFLHLNFAAFDWSTLPQIIMLFGLVSLAAMTEHIGDMMTASAASERNLLEDPGLHRTLLGDGVGSFIGTLIGAQPNTTYSEYTSTIVVSKVASVYVTFTTACTLILLGIFGPFNQFITSLPNCVFAGVSMVAYGMIAMAGLRTIIDNRIDFSNNKNVAIFATMLACGVSGFSITYGSFNLSGIALAMVVGIILNLILKDSKEA
jgi:uracil permease